MLADGHGFFNGFLNRSRGFSGRKKTLKRLKVTVVKLEYKKAFENQDGQHAKNGQRRVEIKSFVVLVFFHTRQSPLFTFFFQLQMR